MSAHRPIRTTCGAVSFAALALAPLAPAAETAANPPAATPNSQAVSALGKELAAAGTPEAVRELRDKLRKARPAAELAALLGDDRLAVRLGALEVLEDLAGNDFGFDAWLPPGSPENAEPLARARAWASTGKSGESRAAKADEATLRGYLNDTLGEDDARRERALRMMLRQGLPALKVLETHRGGHPDLSDAAKARLAQARYAIALHEAGNPAARTLARDLAFGTRERRLEALGALRAAGPGALPVTGEFLDNPEPLVRETAVEVFMALGGEATHATIASRVKQENDVNVLHAVLRALGEKRSATGGDIARSLLSHADEEIVCGALECLFPKESDSGSVSDDTLNRLRELAEDPRWRLRAAALDAIARLKLSAETRLIAKGLEDADAFVRSAAIRAAVESKARDMIARLEKLADTDDDTQMPAVRALKSFGRPVPESLAARIPSMHRDRILAWLTASQGVQEERIYPPQSALLTLARSNDADIARAALLTLLERHAQSRETLALTEKALAAATPEELPTLIAAINLPARGKSSRREQPVEQADEPAASAEVDGLFAALVAPGAKPAPVAAPVAAPASVKPAAPSTEAPGSAADILAPFLRHDSPAVRRAAQLRFATAGDTAALNQLSKDWASVDPDERLALSERLALPDNAEGAGVLRALLRDPLMAVRRNALGRLDSDSSTLRRAAFEACVEADSTLNPGEVLEPMLWRLEYSDRKTGWPDELGRRLLKPGTPTNRIVLGIILAGGSLSRLPEAELRQWTAHADPLVRRAAWFALVRHAPLRASREVAGIAADTDACVRAVAPRLALPDGIAWEHRLSPAVSVRLESSSSRASAAITKTLTPILGKLLDDPDASVRFDAALALLGVGKPVEASRFTDIFRAQTNMPAARARIAALLNASASAMPRATLRRLASFLDAKELDSQTRSLLAESSAGKTVTAPLTMAELAAVEAAPEMLEGASPDSAGADKPAVAATPSRTPLVFFVKPGCRECDRVDSLLKTLCSGDPNIVVVRHNITDTDGLLLNRRLNDLREVTLKEAGKTPAVFGADGLLIGERITGPALEKLVSDSRRARGDDSWTILPESEKPALAAKVGQTYAGLSLAVIVGAGLLDGLNPCAFATLIFLVSYLQVARRSPREILMVGGAFVSAVYLTYFSIGLGLHGALGALGGLGWVRGALNVGFALLAGTLAVLCVRDGLLARAGKLREMNLQLPGFLKDRIRGVIREGAKARHFVIFAFFSGAAISLLELACTGQVYAPIVNQIRQGSLNAIGALAAYNAAFIAPLLAVFALAYGGLRSDALIRFQQRHTATVRFATAAMFVTLAGLLIYAEWRTRFAA